MSDDQERFTRQLVEASRAETPREGAKARALGVVLPELQVAHARETESRRRRSRGLSWVAGGSGFLLFVTLFGSGLYIKHQKDVAEAEQAQAAADLAAQKAQTDKLMAELKAQTDSVASLASAVQNAKDDAARAAAVAQLDEAKRAQEATKARINSGRAGDAKPADGRPRPACNCTPGDPLCSCIP